MTVGGRRKTAIKFVPHVQQTGIFGVPQRITKVFSILSVYKKRFTFATENVRYPSLTPLEHGIFLLIFKREMAWVMKRCHSAVSKCCQPSRQYFAYYHNNTSFWPIRMNHTGTIIDLLEFDYRNDKI